MDCLKIVLTVVLCVTSIASCFCWAISAVAHVPASIPGTIVSWVHKDGSETDLYATLKKQSKWNKLAAALASVAALTQGVLVLTSP